MPGIQKNVAYTLDIGLFLSGSLVMSPTLATGDFKISKDNGATANLATLPVVSPSSSGVVKVVLAQAEMNADRVTIIGRDAAGANWEDVLVALNTTGDTVDTVKTVVDSILVDTGTTLDTKLNTIDDFLDTEIAAITAAVITNAAGADVAADIIAIKAETATIVADTNELQSDDIPGTLSTLTGKVDTVDGIVDAILVDTNELQSDDVPGLIATLDAVVDTVKVDTAAILVDTNELQTDDIPAKIAALDDIPGSLSTLTSKVDTIDNFLDTEIAAITAAVITNAAGADVAADIIAIKAETATIVTDTDVIDDGTSGLVKIASDVAAILVDTGTTLQGELDGIQADTEDIQTRLPAALVNSRMDSTMDATGFEAAAVAEIATALLTTQMTESYAANGVAPTLAQAQFAVHQFMMQHGISGTAWTVRKLDDTTTAFVVTLDDATSPTDAKRV